MRVCMCVCVYPQNDEEGDERLMCDVWLNNTYESVYVRVQVYVYGCVYVCVVCMWCLCVCVCICVIHNV